MSCQVKHYNRVTAEFVLAGATLMVPRNRSNHQRTGANFHLMVYQGRRGGGLVPRRSLKCKDDYQRVGNHFW